MNDKEIAKDILVNMINNTNFYTSVTSQAKDDNHEILPSKITDIICESYSTIYNTVSNATNPQKVD